jgi:hypothetical protein
LEEAGIDKNLALRARAAGDTDGEHLYDTRQWPMQRIAEALNVVHSIIVKDLRIVMSLACGILLDFAPAMTAAQTRQYIWSDIDCRQSRIAAWPGLTCRATNVVASEGNIGVFRQWAAFGTSRDGYYAHLFLWEAQNSFSYLSADETTADFVKGIFEYGKSIAQVSPVAHYADYVTFKDGKAGRTCIGFRRVGRPQRGGYDALTGGILCAPPGIQPSIR